MTMTLAAWMILASVALIALSLHTMEVHYSARHYRVASFVLSASLLVLLFSLVSLNLFTAPFHFALVFILLFFAGVFHTREFQPLNAR